MTIILIGYISFENPLIFFSIVQVSYFIFLFCKCHFHNRVVIGEIRADLIHERASILYEKGIFKSAS